MNISTIEQGEELLKASTPRPWEYIDLHVFGGCKPKDTDFVLFLVNHASELLQIAREVEELKKKVENLQWHYNDMQSRNPDA